MKDYLEAKVGQKLGVTRVGVPKEVYFEATLTAVRGGVAVFADAAGREVALGVDKILVIGPPEEPAAGGQVGFRS